VAMRQRLLACLHHLIGGDDVAAGGVDVAGDRIDHDQVAPLGLLHRHEFAGLVERRLRRRVAPHRRLEFRPRRWPHGGLRPRPAWREAKPTEFPVIGRANVLVHGLPPRPVVWAETAGATVADCSPGRRLAKARPPRTTSMSARASPGSASARHATWPSGRT